MKILFYICSLSGGGAEHTVCELASYLCAAGHECDILTTVDTERVYPLHPAVSCHTPNLKYRRIKGLNRLERILKVKQYMKASHADVGIVFLPEPIATVANIKKSIPFPLIFSERSNPDTYSPSLQRTMRKSFAIAEGAVFQTTDAKAFYFDSLQKGGGQCAVIPNAILTDIPETSVGEKSKTIVAVGGFRRVKNHALLFRSFAEVLKKYPDYRLTVYGDGALRSEYESLLADLHITENVALPGFVKNPMENIKNAAFFVQSSDFEGMSNALSEAMAVGLPCITTENGGAKSIMENGKNGIILPVNDQEKMTEAMLYLIENPKKAAEIGENAAQIGQLLSKDKIFSRWEDFLASVVSHKKQNK